MSSFAEDVTKAAKKSRARLSRGSKFGSYMPSTHSTSLIKPLSKEKLSRYNSLKSLSSPTLQSGREPQFRHALKSKSTSSLVGAGRKRVPLLRKATSQRSLAPMKQPKHGDLRSKSTGSFTCTSTGASKMPTAGRSKDTNQKQQGCADAQVEAFSAFSGASNDTGWGRSSTGNEVDKEAPRGFKTRMSMMDAAASMLTVAKVAKRWKSMADIANVASDQPSWLAVKQKVSERLG